MADEVWIDVLPSMGKFGTQLIKDASGSAKKAGTESGKQFKKTFEQGADGSGDAMVNELEGAQKRASGLVQKLSGDVSRARIAQRQSAADLIASEQRLTDAISKYGAESSQAQAATLKLDNSRDKARLATDKFETSELALKNSHKSLKTITNQLQTAQHKANTEVKKGPGLWGKLETASSSAKSKIQAFGKSLGGVAVQAAGAVGGIALVKEAMSQGFEMEKGIDKMNASLAATPEQSRIYGAAAGELYSQAYGESMGDVTNAVDAVVSSMGGMRTASQKDIESITKAALDLSSAFEVDIKESTTAAGILMKTGLAKDGTEAMDLIAGAMSKVPAQVRGEILPSLAEYSKHYAALGLDGETAMGLIVAASADGVIGVDKVGDAVKEFGIRATDLSKSTSGVYESMGLNTKQMTNDLLAGGDTAKAAMGKIVTGLQGIKDPGQQAAAAIALFGTPIEDLGVDKIPQFLESINPMTAALGDSEGAAAALGDTLNDNTTTGLEQLKRTFMSTITEALEPILPYLEKVMKWALDTPGVLEGVGIALGVVTIGVTALTLVASPWLAIILGVGVAIGGLILLIKNWGTIMDWLKMVWGKVTTWVSEKWSAMASAITQWYNDKIKPTIDAVGAIFTAMWTTYIKPAVDGVKNGWSKMGDSLKATWNWINDKVLTPFKSGIKIMGEAFGKSVDTIKSSWDKVKEITAKPVNFVIETVYTKGIKNVWDKVASKVGLDLKLPTISPIRFASGGVLPGYTPGRDVHHFQSPTGGGLSLSGGEAIMRPEFTRAMGGASGIARLNSAAIRGDLNQAFAGGGVWDSVKNGFSKAGGWIKDSAGKAWNWAGDAATAVGNFISDPIGAIVELIGKPVKNMLKNVAPGITGDVVSQIPGTFLTGLGEWSKKAVSGMTQPEGYGTGGKGTPGMGYKSMVNILKTAFPSIGINSTYRPGAITAVGTKSLHGMGRAVDMSPRMDVFNWIKKNYPNSTELIYSPAGNQQLYKGHNKYYTGITRSNHFNHVHWGMKDGGVIPTKFDNGGVLQPGVSTVINKTSKPEAILTNSQWAAIEKMATTGTINGVGNVDVTIRVEDLEGIRTLEEFVAMARRRSRQKVGA